MTEIELPDQGAKTPRRRKSSTTRKRGLLVGGCVVLVAVAVGGAVGATYASEDPSVSSTSPSATSGLWTGTDSPAPDARELPQPEPEMNMLSNEYPAVMRQALDGLELPPGSTKAEAVEHFTKELNQTRADWPPKDYPSDWPPVPSPRITQNELSASVADYQVIAWYEYWMGASPEERKAAQPMLDSFQDSAALWRAMWSHDDMPGSRMVLIARIAEAAKHNDEGPMRFYLFEHDSEKWPIEVTGGG